MEISTNDYFIVDAKSENSFTFNVSSDNEKIDFNYCIEEMKKPSPNAYLYEVWSNDVLKGIFKIDIISKINEFKLGVLHYYFDDENVLEKVLKDFLNYEIIKNSMLKITCKLSSDNLSSKVLLNNKFVLNKEDGNLLEYKITKPLFLG